MSFFPSPDPEKVLAGWAQAPSDFRQPITPASSHTGPQSPSFTPDFAQCPPVHQHGNHWSSYETTGEPRGLGLVAATDPHNGHMAGAFCFTSPSTTVAFPWPSEAFAAHVNPLPAVPIIARQDTWGGYCKPSSALMPVTLWDSPMATVSSALPPHASPHMSEGSVSSHLSYLSSPGQQSVAYAHSAPSPLVKLEESIDMAPHKLVHLSTADIHAVGDAKFDSSVDPDPIHSWNALEPSHVVYSSPSSQADDVVDIKPPVDPQAHASGRRARSEGATGLTRCNSRAKRGFTRAENAKCHCDKCGKLFQRSYNLKAHMKTHELHRDQPHICQYAVCDKRFVRKTDLIRHEQSVHIKARNCRCPMCHSCFARKDTLRRHIDDGCPMRAEVKKRVPRPTYRRSQSGPAMRATVSFRPHVRPGSQAPAEVQ